MESETGKRKRDEEAIDSAPNKSQRLSSFDGSKIRQASSFSNTNELVTFKIGKDSNEQTFTIHKDHACMSTELQDIFNGNSMEGETQSYTMADVSPETFRRFVQYLYTRSFDGLPSLLAPVVVGAGEEQHREQCEIIGLYLLGQELSMPSLQNAAMRALCQGIDRIHKFPLDKIPWIWENTSADSPLRLLVIRLCAIRPKSKFFEKHGKYISKELLQALVISMHEDHAKGVNRAGKWELKANEFYVHDEEND